MNAAVTVTANHPPSSAYQRIATMYAMDYPYQYQLDEVIAMDNMTMSAEDKKKFFQTNAETVFKIA